MMSLPWAERVAVIIASIDARATIHTSLEGFLRETCGRGQVILVDASRDGTANEAERHFPDVRVIRRAPGRLAPELWRDGLSATEAPLIAFSTAQMVPRTGWLQRLVARLDETGAAVVGGPIEPAEWLSPNDRATYLLRYVNYLGPLESSVRIEPAGDNSVYRRDCLRGLDGLWSHGFWEVEIHRALQARGERLALAGDAAVEFQGGTYLLASLRQRHAHARHYGASRSRRMHLVERMSRSATAPVVPAVLLRRIAAALGRRGMSLRPWLPALPQLALLLATWSGGELQGTWLGPRESRTGAA